MSRRIDHKIWKDPPHLLGCQPGTRLVRLSQDPRRKRSLLKLKPEDILPLYARAKKLRFDIETLSETRIVLSFSADRKGI
jgi:hypothetical protein